MSAQPLVGGPSSATLSKRPSPGSRRAHGIDVRADPAPMRWAIIATAIAFLGLFVVLPLLNVFVQAFSKGWQAYWSAINSPDALDAIYLTLLAAGISVALNLVFGVTAAWAISKVRISRQEPVDHRHRPAVRGVAGHRRPGLHPAVRRRRGISVHWLQEHDIRIVFALPGIVLATVFVTFPFVARELIPLMREQGTQDEEAALSLGASGLRTFFRVTLPNVKWALLYGVLLCNARAMGEFGAVSVVSGHVRGETNTMPLHIEILYNEYQFTAAFAVASLLALLALVTLVAKVVVEQRSRRASDARERPLPAPNGLAAPRGR